MKIAIITRPAFRTPRNNAISFQLSLKEIGIESKIFYNDDTLRRLVPLNEKLRYPANFHYRLRQKIQYYFKDKKILNELKEYDAIVISETIPNNYWKGYYGLPQLKKITNKKLGCLAVFFLDASPNFVNILKENGDYLQNIYDFHLAYSKVSYIKTETSPKKFEVGLNLKRIGLKPHKKEGFYVLVDFKYEGNEHYYSEQIKVLNELNIPYKRLEGKYTFEEIRKLYKGAAVFLMQHYESFGLPIAECLSYCTKVFTADSSWPAAFRLDENPGYYEKGRLADCFDVYDDSKALGEKLLSFKNDYDLEKTPFLIFDEFKKYYEKFYVGNNSEVERFVNNLNQAKI
jgi:hypothetical protein